MPTIKTMDQHELPPRPEQAPRGSIVDWAASCCGLHKLKPIYERTSEGLIKQKPEGGITNPIGMACSECGDMDAPVVPALRTYVYVTYFNSLGRQAHFGLPPVNCIQHEERAMPLTWTKQDASKNKETRGQHDATIQESAGN